MTLNQSFQVLPHGAVTGGSFHYSANTDTGVISYSGSVIVKVLFFSRTIALDPGTVTVNPSLLLSSSFQMPSATISVPPVLMTVTEVNPNVSSQVSITITGQSMTGVGTIDTTHLYILISKVTAVGNVGPFAVSVEIDPVSSSVKPMWKKSFRDLFRKVFGI
jgi:hypothetical protein